MSAANCCCHRLQVKETNPLRLVAINFKEPKLGEESLVSLIKEAAGASSSSVGILTSFNSSRSSVNNNKSPPDGFHSVFGSTEICTDISTSNMKGGEQFDDIYMNESLSKVYTGCYNVVRDGLTNPWIPDGWKWGGLASDRCPVFADFYLC